MNFFIKIKSLEISSFMPQLKNTIATLVFMIFMHEFKQKFSCTHYPIDQSSIAGAHSLNFLMGGNFLLIKICRT